MAETPSPDTTAEVHHPTQPMPYLAFVDPTELVQENNSRDEIPIEIRDPKLTLSVHEKGVDTPITANPTPDGRLRVRYGFGRTQAAVLAVKQHPTIMVIVADDSDDRPESVLLDQMAENEFRTGYTEAELAHNYGRLVLDYGIDIDEVAKATHQPVEVITAGLAVAQSPRTKDASRQTPQLGLLELEPLTEFEDDPDLHAKLVDTLVNWPERFDYTIAEFRDRRVREQRITDAENHLCAEGYAIAEDDEDLPDGAHLLHDLYADADELTVLTPEAHTDCPGRAVHITTDYTGEVTVTEMCLAFDDHGHREIAAANVSAAEEALRTDGVIVLQGDLPDTAQDLAYLTADASAGTSLSADDHADCPGHAAYVDNGRWGGQKAVTHYLCTNVAEYGHHDVQQSAPIVDEPSAEYRRGERKRAERNNAAWQVQTERRRTFLATTLFASWRRREAKALPHRVEHWLALAAVDASGDLADAAPRHDYASNLLKLKAPKGDPSANLFRALLRRKNTTQQQAVMIRLAQVVGAMESYFDKKFTKGNADVTWRRPRRDTKFYFELLEALGYTLSPVEQLVNNPQADAADWPHLAATLGANSAEGGGAITPAALGTTAEDTRVAA